MIDGPSSRARDTWYSVCVAISDVTKTKRLRSILEWVARVFGYGYLIDKPKSKLTWDVLNGTRGDNRIGEQFLARLERR
jgi:hypothetical protein